MGEINTDGIALPELERTDVLVALIAASAIVTSVVCYTTRKKN